MGTTRIIRSGQLLTADERDALDAAAPSALDPLIVDSDSRLTDTRDPNAHAASHADGGSDEVTPDAIGALRMHGIESSTEPTFNDTTHVVTLPTATTYWYQGTKRVNSGDTTCDLDEFVTLTANTIYYVYFEDATGTLKASASAWSLATKVPVCTVYWNGSAGAVVDERHTHTRDLKWHAWAHLTVGARISAADFGQTFPASADAWVPATHYNAGGTLWDEDIGSAIPSQSGSGSKFRVWYEVSAGVFTWVDSDYPYPTNVRFVDTDNSYTLTDVGTAAYINVWVYASPDISDRLYAFVESRTAEHGTIAAARAINPPNLSNCGLTSELKLLYRLIFRGNENYYENTDYRSSASLPAGGTSAPPSAATVSVIPVGSIAADNVQAALEELDSEKQAALTFGIADTNAVRVDDASAADNDYAKFTANGVEGVPYATVLSDIAALPLAGGTMTGNITLSENTGVALDPAGSADGKWSGVTMTGVAGYTVAFGDLVYLDPTDSRWEKADVSAAAAADGDARGILGMVVSTSGGDGDTITILLMGNIRADTNFPALTVNSPAYASTTGDITTMQPSTSGHVIRIIGWAITADEIHFRPDGAWITKV